eukprot:9489996-Pyramimonas_sp.AAC.2
MVLRLYGTNGKTWATRTIPPLGTFIHFVNVLMARCNLFSIRTAERRLQSGSLGRARLPARPEVRQHGRQQARRVHPAVGPRGRGRKGGKGSLSGVFALRGNERTPGRCTAGVFIGVFPWVFPGVFPGLLLHLASVMARNAVAASGLVVARWPRAWPMASLAFEAGNSERPCTIHSLAAVIGALATI